MTQTARPTLERITTRLIQAMAKHLPPSADGLRLLDVNGFSGAVLLGERPDLVITAADADALASLPDGGFDAVTAFDVALDDSFLGQARRLLRPGGRLIAIDSERDPDEAAVTTLQGAGFDRILVETGAECPLPVGMLARGEQPHTTDDTLARVAVASDRDPRVALAGFNGRSIHLLIRQTPNIPVWKRAADTVIRWEAAALVEPDGGAMLLAFSSLPSAVGFMQTAVLGGAVTDVNKVGKFPRTTALAWERPIALNPPIASLDGRTVTWVAVDPDQADQPDE